MSKVGPVHASDIEPGLLPNVDPDAVPDAAAEVAAVMSGAAAHCPAPDGICSRGFLALLVVQFFGALNDNVLKGVLSFGVAFGGLWSGALPRGGQALVGLCLTVPFILFSAWGGQIADRYDKRRLTVIIKVIELTIAIVAIAAFVLAQVWTALGCMLLLATQSAFFGPVKYGVIPELVTRDRLGPANGVINLSTNLAIIVGTLAAGPVYDAYAPAVPIAVAGTSSIGALPSLPIVFPVSTIDSSMSWLPGVVLLLVALLGVVPAILMRPLRPADPGSRIGGSPLRVYAHSLRQMADGPLLRVVFAWSGFYMIGMIALLILPDYRALLGVSATQASLLLGGLGIAIGIGSAIAGFASRSRIRPMMVVGAAIGMTTGFGALGVAPLRFDVTLALLVFTGVAAGFYIVPLQALLQWLSPDADRGRFLGTANALSFVFSSAGSLVFLASREWFEIPSRRIFLICAALSVVGAVALWVRRRHVGAWTAEPGTGSGGASA